MTNTPSTPIYSIYLITNLINNKKYVGFTSQNPPEKRWSEHVKNKKSILSKAIQKHNKINFTFEVILQGWDIEHMLDMEKYFIKEHNSYKSGYNCTLGGNGSWGVEVSNETRMKLSLRSKEMWKNVGFREKMSSVFPFLGKRHTEETKKKISINRSGIPVSDETRRKWRLRPGSNKGKFGEASSFYGHKHTEEYKINASRRVSGCNNPMYGKSGEASPRSKKYIIQLPENKICTIHGLSEFCRMQNISRTGLNKAYNKNQSYKGYKILQKL